MTEEDIYKMVRESELGFLLGDNWMLHHEFEYFAKLVAQKEREACQDLCKWRTGVQQVDAAIDTCAAAIRARGYKQDGQCKLCTDGCPACDATKLPKEAHDLF